MWTCFPLSTVSAVGQTNGMTEPRKQSRSNKSSMSAHFPFWSPEGPKNLFLSSSVLYSIQFLCSFVFRFLQHFRALPTTAVQNQTIVCRAKGREKAEWVGFSVTEATVIFTVGMKPFHDPAVLFFVSHLSAVVACPIDPAWRFLRRVLWSPGWSGLLLLGV